MDQNGRTCLFAAYCDRAGGGRNNRQARIYRYNPGIKIIAILRSPVVRAFSAWNFRRARLRDRRDFMTAVRVEIASGGDLSVARENKYRYVDTGHYADQLRELRRVFPAENLLLMKAIDPGTGGAQVWLPSRK